MKLLVMSDLHFEWDRQFKNFYDEKLIYFFNNYGEYDYIILAGDIDSGFFIGTTLEKIQNLTNKPIIFICGNHEYYYFKRKEINRLLSEIENENIIVLNQNVVEIGDYIFIGATGWCDETNGEFDIVKQNQVNDFRYILNQNIFEWGHSDRIFFETKLDYYYNNSDKKIICISHNIPIPKLNNSNYLDSFFRNDWEYMIYNWNPNLWICGHSHESMDIMINDCRIVNNPRGYCFHDENNKFDKNFIIEI